MIPRKAIELAIEGGGDGKRWASMHRGKVVEGGVSAYWEVIALDPAFWEALWKALVWHHDSSRVNGEKVYKGHRGDWSGNAHRFFDLILTKQDTAQFWDEILGAKTK